MVSSINFTGVTAQPNQEGVTIQWGTRGQALNSHFSESTLGHAVSAKIVAIALKPNAARPATAL